MKKTSLHFLFGCLLALAGECAGESGMVIDLPQVSVEISSAVPAKGRARLEKAAKELADHVALVCGERPKGGGVRLVLGAPPTGEKPAKEFEGTVAFRDGLGLGVRDHGVKELRGQVAALLKIGL